MTPVGPTTGIACSEDASVGKGTLRLRVLVTPVFLLPLVVLLLNDFVLKASFPHWTTGKISDVAGLFAFATFCRTILPQYRGVVVVATAASFIYWKSAYSQPLIELWNAAAPISIGRTVDLTDLLALPILALAYGWPQHRGSSHARPWVGLVVALLALFAFTATSLRGVCYRYDHWFSFSYSAADLEHRLEALEYPRRSYGPLGILPPDEVQFKIPTDACAGALWATIRVAEFAGGSALHLVEMRCTSGSPDRGQLLSTFRATIPRRLKDTR